MLRRFTILQRCVAPARSAPSLVRCAAEFSAAPTNIIRPLCGFSRHYSSESGTAPPKKVEDIMPIATGPEREELEAELKGIDLLETNNIVGPFGTKEAPAKIKAYYSKRIIGCPGGEGEDEHDVVWFWLEQGKPHECPVCGQYFELEVVGPGGPPPGYEDSEEEEEGEDDEEKKHH